MIGIVMGSKTDWATMKEAAKMLRCLNLNYEIKVISAHRTPDFLFQYAETAKDRLKVIIAGAGGAAHLPGMLAAKTTVPVLGVPVPSTYLNGLDSLFSICQMPTGTPVATFTIGETGAKNAALFAAQIIAVNDKNVHDIIVKYKKNEEQIVLQTDINE